MKGAKDRCKQCWQSTDCFGGDRWVRAFEHMNPNAITDIFSPNLLHICLNCSFGPQIIVGIVFILLGRLNINFFIDRKRADFLNNASVILIFLIAVVNVLITAFGPTDRSGATVHQPTAWTNFYPGKIPEDNHN